MDAMLLMKSKKRRSIGDDGRRIQVICTVALRYDMVVVGSLHVHYLLIKLYLP